MGSGRLQRIAESFVPSTFVGESYLRLVRGSHVVRVVIAIAAMGATPFLPGASGADRLAFLVLIGAVYLPYAVALLMVSRRSQNPATRLAAVVGDVGIVFLFQLLVPPTYVVSLFGYLMIVAFYSYIGGPAAGISVSAAAVGLTSVVLASRSGETPGGVYLVVMYAPVLVSLVYLLHTASREQRAALEALRREVAERKRAQQELERSNRDLEQFAYVASHDLKEPLRAVSSSLELVSERYANGLDEKARQFMGYAVDGARRMKALIDDLLAYARLSTEAVEPRPTPVADAVEEACRNLRAAIAESGARVDWGALPTIEADAVLIVQLFQNLIANAIKFRGSRAPSVEIGASRSGELWTFTVSDNGIGMDSEQRERIFELFGRLHTREEYPGTGIGLALCKRIVERHGGRIWVESTPDEGSRFHFTLPGAADG